MSLSMLDSSRHTIPLLIDPSATSDAISAKSKAKVFFTLLCDTTKSIKSSVVWNDKGITNQSFSVNFCFNKVELKFLKWNCQPI